MPDDRVGVAASGAAMPVYLVADGEDTLMTVRVIPRAGQTALAGDRAGALLVRIAAPPVENAANDALISFLSDILHAPRSAIAVVHGEHSRSKRLRVRNATPGAVAARLAAAQGITLL